jgi:hypothetical protein
MRLNCNRYGQCNANLCPLDPGLKNRIWYADEEVCSSRKYGNRRWIKKQRLIQKRQYKKWMDRPITQQQLFDVSRPPAVTKEEQERRREQVRKFNYCRIKDQSVSQERQLTR